MEINLKQPFTKEKFIKLELEKKHKVCAKILRYYFDTHDPNCFSIYNNYRQWLELDLVTELTNEDICNFYHEHLKNANIKVKEHNLLTKKGDRLTPAKKTLPLTLFLDHIRSAHNVGSILRTVEALNLGTVVFSDKMPFIDNPQVQKTSMTTSSKVTCRIDTLFNLPRPIIALETSHNAISIHDFIFPNTFTLVVGNEEYGCSENTLKHADFVLEIPMRGRKNSLNVANALALCAGEIIRQKSLISED